MSIHIHVLKLTAVGACAAVALGYSGAVALDGIGMTAAADREPVRVVRQEDSGSDRIKIESEPIGPASRPPFKTQELVGGEERPTATGTPQLDEARASPMSTGSLGDAPHRQGGTAPVDAKLNLAPPSEMLREERMDESAAEPITLGIGLAKMGPFEMPLTVEPRTEPSALRNVELLEPPPPPPRLELPQERVIQIGPNAAKDPAADASAKPAQKPRKSAKRKRKTDDSLMSYFGW